jgi:endonuclease YncB( thermonuclease family)
MLSKRRIFLVSLILFFYGGLVFGFDNLKTHPELSVAAAELYNQTASRQLTLDQIELLAQGSVDEDADPRYLNHYYDPVTGQGLNEGLWKGMAAKDWAKKQNSATGDYSVDAIFFNYREGNYARAYQGIGHIIHLIQDMAVPAHTRNDAHPEGDPFENWAAANGRISLNGLNKVSINNLDSAFTNLASFSNNNFFSKDSIFVLSEDSYMMEEEKVDDKKVKYLINVLDDNEYKIAYITNPDSLTPNYGVGGDDKVNSDYWNLLYPKAIGYSAGVIEYFLKGFDQIDQEKLNQEKLSFWRRIGYKIVAWNEDFKYSWGDVFMASRLAAGSAWNSLFGTGKPENIAATSEDNLESSEGQVLSESIASDSEAEKEIDNLLDSLKNDEIVPELSIKQVVDGDTIILTNNEVVRYLGIDAPELGQPGSQDDECLAWVARLRNMDFLDNGELRLVKDPNVDKDENGRLLRYVYSGDSFLNEKMALAGLARDSFCSSGVKNCPVANDKNRIGLIKNAFASAKENKRGLFSGVCDGADRIIPEPEQAILIPELSNNATTTEPDEIAGEVIPENNSNGIEFPIASTTNPLVGYGGGSVWIAPSEPNFKINSFNLFDLISGSIYFSASSTVGLGLETSDPVDAYFLSASNTEPGLDSISWMKDFPEDYFLDDSEGLKIIYLWLKKDNKIIGSASSAIYLDLSVPQLSWIEKPEIFSSLATSSFRIVSSENEVVLRYKFDENTWQMTATNTIFSNDSALNEGNHLVEAEAMDLAGNLADLQYEWLVDYTPPSAILGILAGEYLATGFTVGWSGEDTGVASTSGADSFDLEYQIGAGDWQAWLSATTSYSAIFDQALAPGDEISFRVRARDKAGNLGEWSEEVSARIASLPENIGHLVISEIQVGGDTASDEFVELYNAGSSAINLKNFKLTHKNSNGNESNLLTKFPDVSLPAYSYYLIAHPTGYAWGTAPDSVYSSASYSISNNNTIILYDENMEVVDKVGLGSALDYETEAYSGELEDGYSIERKAGASSTSELMKGDHRHAGNSYDSDNNNFDFVERSFPNPQNLESETEDPAYLESNPMHQWLFTEESGLTVFDQIANDDLTLASSTLRGDDFIQLAAGETITRQFNWPSEKKDFSFSFWINHTNNKAPLSVSLIDSGGNKIVGLDFNQVNNYLLVNDAQTIFSHDRLRDGLWSYITLVYNSDKSQILFYVHGDLILTLDDIIFNEAINELNIENSVEAGVDDNSLFNMIIWKNPVIESKIWDNMDQDIEDHPDLRQIFAC